jgi:hypothetical protein
MNMNRHQRILIPVLAALTFLAVTVLPAAPAAAQQDVVTVGSAIANNPNVDVPVYIRDTSGTPLGVDQPAGSKLQAYSLRVTFSPAAAVDNATFTKAGITSGLTSSFSNNPQSPGATSLIETYPEATSPIPFTSNAVLPGNQVAHILVHLAPGVTPGQVITMTVDPVLTQLGNDTGTTNESVGASNLTLVPGTITVSAAYTTNIPALSSWMLVLLAAALAAIAIRITT